MLQLLFTLIFIIIAIFVIYPLFKKELSLNKEADDLQDSYNSYEVLENDYNLGLISKTEFNKEKSELKSNASN